jgi:hypothetical protein
LNRPQGLPSSEPRLKRFLHRRRFYPQLAKIVAGTLVRREPRDRVFVSLMGGVGDLVNAFPTLEALAARAPVELATGGDPYRALAEAAPCLARVYSPFVYKPIRRAHRRLIQRVLAPFYARVILLDNVDREWWARGRHISATYAELCGCPPPAVGKIYLADSHRQEAARYAEAQGLDEFLYVAQVIRARRPYRSWPLRHYQELLRMLRRSSPMPIVVDTTGSDETEVPDFCLRLPRLPILVAAALIARASLFVGPDSGLTHVAGALGVPTVSIHLGYPPESCRALGTSVRLVEQRVAFEDPANTAPEAVFAAVEALRLAA